VRFNQSGMRIRRKIYSRFSSNSRLIEATHPRRAAQRLRRLAERADESTTHPLRIAEASGFGDALDRLGGRLNPQIARSLRKGAKRQIRFAGLEPVLELARVQRHRARAHIRRKRGYARDQRRQETKESSIWTSHRSDRGRNLKGVCATSGQRRRAGKEKGRLVSQTAFPFLRQPHIQRAISGRPRSGAYLPAAS
jgi:hypothetical protein